MTPFGVPRSYGNTIGSIFSEPSSFIGGLPSGPGRPGIPT